MRSNWLSHSVEIARKDWRAERRTQSGLASTFLFALVTLAAVSMSVGPFGATRDLLASLLWVLLLFAGLAGLSRVFVREVDARTAPHLKLLATPHEVLLGKALYNLGLLGLVELFVVPLYLVVMDLHVPRPWVLLGTLALADVGLVAASTLLAAMVAQARSRGALFSGLAIPILLPLLLAAMGGTKAAFGASPDASTHLTLLTALDLALAGACMWLIEPIWNE